MNDIIKNQFARWLQKVLYNKKPLLNGIRNAQMSGILQFSIFSKKYFSASLRPLANTFFKCHNPKGIKFFVKLSLELSYIRPYQT